VSGANETRSTVFARSTAD